MSVTVVKVPDVALLDVTVMLVAVRLVKVTLVAVTVDTVDELEVVELVVRVVRVLDVWLEVVVLVVVDGSQGQVLVSLLLMPQQSSVHMVWMVVSVLHAHRVALWAHQYWL